jgi:hypothetical protein
MPREVLLQAECSARPAQMRLVLERRVSTEEFRREGMQQLYIPHRTGRHQDRPSKAGIATWILWPAAGLKAVESPEPGTFMRIDPRIAAQLRVNWCIGLLPPTEPPVPSVGNSMNVGRQARTSSSMAHGCPGFPSKISRPAIVNRYEY